MYGICSVYSTIYIYIYIYIYMIHSFGRVSQALGIDSSSQFGARRFSCGGRRQAMHCHTVLDMQESTRSQAGRQNQKT